MLRFLTAGESHGRGLTAIIEGLPAGLALSVDKVNQLLSRRQRSYGRGRRMKKIEHDRVEIIGGTRNGLTLGSPLALYIENEDWANRKNKIDRPKHVPRPGHADLAGAIKYDFDDIQNVIERASARETAMRTAVGAVALQLLAEFAIDIVGHTVAIGGAAARPYSRSVADIRAAAEHSPVYCADPRASELMCAEIDRAGAAGDTLGGVFEIVAAHVPPGLGSYVHWDRRLTGCLGQAVLSIPSVKGVEFGEAVRNARRPGSRAHDRIVVRRGTAARTSNRAGGLEGGVTNGEEIRIRGYAKPISSLKKPLSSIDLKTNTPAAAPYVRSDVCVVPAICVIGEAMAGWTIAEALVEKFGGDSLREVKDNHRQYLNHVHVED
jgi:chorismate synthase